MTRIPSRGRSMPVRTSAVLVAVALLRGCGTPPTADVPDTAFEPPPYATLAEAQNRRVEQLRTIYSRGVMELRWTDDDGDEHFEPQVNVDLWVSLPRRTALRLEKLGDVLFWIGSDDERFWIFDLMSDERVLYSWPHEVAVRFESSALSIRPLVLLDLMGLSTLPPPGDASAPNVEVDRSNGTLVLTSRGRAGPVRIAFNPTTLLPASVEALDDDGAIVATSRLSRHVPVTMHGMSSLEFPHLAEIVRITDADGSSQIDLFLSEPDDGTDQPFDRVFDLPLLRKRMQTDRIEGDLAPVPVASP